MDRERIKNAVRELLIGIGEDPDREGLLETPDRVARMYEEIFSGLSYQPERDVKVFTERFFGGPTKDMVLGWFAEKRPVL